MEITTVHLIEKYHRENLSVYFNLKELIPITGLQYSRLKELGIDNLQKYGSNPSRISRHGRGYKIHYKMVDKFLPERRRRTTIYNEPWKTFYTLNPKFNPKEFKLFESFIESISSGNTEYSFYSAVESRNEDMAKNKHIHIMSTMEPESFKQIVRPIAKTFFYEYKDRTEEVLLKYASVAYLNKANHMSSHQYRPSSI